MNDTKLTVEYMDITALKPYERNARKHEPKNIAAIRKSIEDFGFNDPIGIWHDTIVEGHGRLLAAKDLGMQTVPVIRLDHLDDEGRRAYAIAHNKTAENSEWDMPVLESELRDLEKYFDMTDFGFDAPTDDAEPAEVVEDEVPEEAPTRAKLGDIWQLGEHRLMCGDSTDAECVAKLMDGAKADMFLTDPPYNVDYTDGHENERKIMNDNFATDEECGMVLWLPAFSNAKAYSKDDCSVYCFMPQGGTHMMMMMMMKAGWQVKHELIWRKQSLVLNRADYNYQHEPILFGWNKSHRFYGKGKYHNTSVWEYDRPTKSKEHPTMKPIALLGEILMNSSADGDSVIDLFGGSGSTLIACEQLKRKCYMMELDPHYVDVIIARWEQFTGKEAVLLNG
jgi:site-specific DNA-methyltransferase (adenine-specific)